MPSLRVLLAGVVVAALVAGCGTDSTTGDAPDDGSTTRLSAGPVPTPPGPLRDDALVAPAGNSIVVFGGVTKGANGERGVPVEGGVILDPTDGWKPLTGDTGVNGGLMLAGAVDTGDELLILGTECDESTTEFARNHPDAEDELPCRGNPLRFISVDPATKTMRPLPAPEVTQVVKAEEARYRSLFVNAVGWSSGRAVFNVSGGAPTTTLVYDAGEQTWTSLPSPDQASGIAAAESGGPSGPIEIDPGLTVRTTEDAIVAIGSPGLGQTQRVGQTQRSSTQAWRWDEERRWVQLDDLASPADGVGTQTLGSGAAGVLVSRGIDDPLSAFRLDPTSGTWEQLPDTPPNMGASPDWIGGVSGSLVVWTGLGVPQYLQLEYGTPQWTAHPKPAAYAGDATSPWEIRVYGDRALLLIPETVGASSKPMELVYVDSSG